MMDRGLARVKERGPSGERGLGAGISILHTQMLGVNFILQ
jgi:hypothetical protein